MNDGWQVAQTIGEHRYVTNLIGVVDRAIWMTGRDRETIPVMIVVGRSVTAAGRVAHQSLP